MKRITCFGIIPFCYYVILIASCNQATKKEATQSFKLLEKTNWLIGGWENVSNEGVLSEEWEKENDSIYVGESHFVIGKDTVFSEKISLVQEGNQLFYIPTVNDQNEGLPVRFILTSSTDKQLVFENQKHDFPQKIKYSLITTDSLVAEISGKHEGEMKKETFPMKRVK